MNNTLTVLIAEDDDGHAHWIENGLREGNLNASVTRFCDGQETLDFLLGKATSLNFDDERTYVLLLDIHMPKIDGMEVLRQIKGNPKLHGIPVIMLTTSDDPREIAQCHEYGCNNYIQKPGSFEEFFSAIKTLGRFLSLLQFPSTSPAVAA